MMRYIFILMFVLLCSLPAVGQSAKWVQVSPEVAARDFARLNEWYIKPSYSLKVYYSSYDSCEPDVIIDRDVAYLSKYNKQLIQKGFGLSLYQDDQLKIIVDTNERKVLIGNPSDHLNESNPVSQYLLLLESAKEVEVKNEENIKSYRVSFEESFTVREYEISFKADHIVTEFKIKYRQIKIKKNEGGNKICLPVLSVMFQEVERDFTDTKREDLFNVSDFLIRDKKGKFSPSPKYSGYKIIDQRLKL